MNSTEEQCFITDIRKDPNNNEPRLVYADWLEEQGDIRGELMRLQLELDKSPRCEHVKEKQERVMTIIQEHGATIRKQYIALFGMQDTWGHAKHAIQQNFRRGLPTVAYLKAETFRQTSEIQKIPVERVLTLGDVNRRQLSDYVKHIVQCCPNIQELYLHEASWTSNSDLKELAPLSHLRHLDVRYTRVKLEGAQNLATEMGKTLNDDNDPNTLRVYW